MFNIKYFFDNVPASLNMSENDLCRLSEMVWEIKFLHSMDGHNYCYFFPYFATDVKNVRQLLAKYKVCGREHVTRYGVSSQDVVVRVRYKNTAQLNVLRNFRQNVLQLKNGVGQTMERSR